MSIITSKSEWQTFSVKITKTLAILQYDVISWGSSNAEELILYIFFDIIKDVNFSMIFFTCSIFFFWFWNKIFDIMICYGDNFWIVFFDCRRDNLRIIVKTIKFYFINSRNFTSLKSRLNFSNSHLCLTYRSDAVFVRDFEWHTTVRVFERVMRNQGLNDLVECC